VKKSELVKELQDDIAKHGDTELLEYKVVCELEGKAGYKYSPTRTLKGSSRRAKMNMKEFRAYCTHGPVMSRIQKEYGPCSGGDELKERMEAGETYEEIMADVDAAMSEDNRELTR
jgi:hypothetical protein